MNAFIGTGVALITPFKADLSIDHQALAAVVEFNISNGVNYLVISGTTGESATITAKEKKEISATIIEANKGRVPLVIGIGGNNTAAVVEELQIHRSFPVCSYFIRSTLLQQTHSRRVLSAF